MFDIEKRKNLTGASVAQVIEALSSLPKDAIFHCCGDSMMFLHVERDGSTVCLDTEDLDDVYAVDSGTSSRAFWDAHN